MKDEIIHITSIGELHTLCGFNKPTHPLISVVDVSQWELDPAWVGKTIKMDLYYIALKDGSCGMEYGRNVYDFSDGVLIFTAPQQVTIASQAPKKGQISGWVIFFHPDLIRHTDLGRNIDDYGFFAYDVHEALHLSDAEQGILNDCAKLIASETSARIDSHSQRVIVNTLQLLLSYSLRFYERQFNTRAAQNSDLVSQFKQQLKAYYNADLFSEKGVPSVEYFAEQVHLSPNYLSDLLKKATGLSTKDHINLFIVEKAKNLLLSESDTISGIAYKLGFNYPHYFSRLFKSKTGLTPQAYRDNSHLN